mmetsp:Transcript_11547/g.26492  ORF Transcript_11547/g.26492 Transcript_11547/m.26492 type:complete len:290 (+) Transcript_11547:238-1107(+)
MPCDTRDAKSIIPLPIRRERSTPRLLRPPNCAARPVTPAARGPKSESQRTHHPALRDALCEQCALPPRTLPHTATPRPTTRERLRKRRPMATSSTLGPPQHHLHLVSKHDHQKQHPGEQVTSNTNAKLGHPDTREAAAVVTVVTSGRAQPLTIDSPPASLIKARFSSRAFSWVSAAIALALARKLLMLRARATSVGIAPPCATCLCMSGFSVAMAARAPAASSTASTLSELSRASSFAIPPPSAIALLLAGFLARSPSSSAACCLHSSLLLMPIKLMRGTIARLLITCE